MKYIARIDLSIILCKVLLIKRYLAKYGKICKTHVCIGCTPTRGTYKIRNL